MSTKTLFLGILLLAIFPSEAVSTEDSEEKVILELGPNVGPCVTWTQGRGVTYLVNSCGECRTAVLNWCDRSIQRFDVPGLGERSIPLCTGRTELVTDRACSRAFAEDTLEILGGSCSARNDVGDECSITCKEGESAFCRNASGARTPTCECR